MDSRAFPIPRFPFLRLVLLLALAACGEPDTPTGPLTEDLAASFSVYTGDLVLSTQAEVDAASGITEVTCRR
jgi:hypothetical protein